jgi:uncharacterized protein YbjT (DUF2867 family)
MTQSYIKLRQHLYIATLASNQLTNELNDTASSSMATVIVFGPTGNIGSVAAQTAKAKGAKVVLAMRDTKKSIPGLSEADEKRGANQRVTADVTKPDTIAEAVKSSGATRAFLYLAWGTPDHMKASFQALKDSGVESVVFLSSSTIQIEKKDIPQSEMIPWFHAQAELSLDAVYGENGYVAIRPGRFITNLKQYSAGINAGEVKIFGGDFKYDCTTPTDMGEVAGTILAEGAKDGQTKVYVYGPQIVSQAEAIQAVGKALGKDVKITNISAEEGLQQSLDHGAPPPIAKYLISKLQQGPESDKELGHDNKLYADGVKNVETYTGRQGTGIEDWVKANKEVFTA